MKNSEKSKILVTGGAGFIGSNLVDALLGAGHIVTVLDNFSTGKKENLEQAAKSPDFKLIEGDIRNKKTCEEAVCGQDYIFHEAALGSVSRSIANPAATTEVNVSGFVNVMFSAHQAGVRRVVFASSSSIYGDDATLPKVEDRIGRALSPYAVSKLAGELFAANFVKLYGLEMVGLRYFNVFGPRQDPDGAYAAVIPRFALTMLRHERPLINGDGMISRDFTYIDNVVNANMLALHSEKGRKNCEIFNIACGGTTTLNELCAMLRIELSKYDPAVAKVIPLYGASRKGDIADSLADISRARIFLGYEPKYSVGDGLARSARWYFEKYGVRA